MGCDWLIDNNRKLIKMLLSKISFIVPENKTAKGRSVSEKDYEAKRKQNFIAKWQFEFSGAVS